MNVSLGYSVSENETAAERDARRLRVAEPQSMPGEAGSFVARLAPLPTWTPPGTRLLVRHRSTDGLRTIVTNNQAPPYGFRLEFDLGLVYAHSHPGTRRLISGPTAFLTTLVEGEIAEGWVELGYLETSALAMLDSLRLCRDSTTGEPVVLGGTHDPMTGRAEHVRTLGFIEGYPINPRVAVAPRGFWGRKTLTRTALDEHWRHVYATGAEPSDSSIVLGRAWSRPGPGLVALIRLADGTLTSALLAPALRPRHLRQKLRWALAPLMWCRPVPRPWALSAVAARVRHLGRTQPIPPAVSETLGYLRARRATGWSPLFAARHPAFVDQYVTRSEIEATDLGYEIEGVLGYIADDGAARDLRDLPPEVLWGSRFGLGRRYIEAPSVCTYTTAGGVSHDAGDAEAAAFVSRCGPAEHRKCL